MSEHFAIVVRLGDVIPIDGTDNLAQTMVLGYPVVVRKDEFETYQKAVFVPPGNIVNGIKVKAKKIRGVLSMGMLLSASVEWPEGLDVAKQLGLKRIEEDFDIATECEKSPDWFIKYPDIEAYRRHPGELDGQHVRVTEKIHGTNARFAKKDGRLWCGSRNHARKQSATSVYWRIARDYELDRLPEGIMLFGEIFGKGIQKGFDYGLEGVAFNVFDVWNIVLETWFYRPEDVANRLGIPMVPRVYDGIWRPELEYLADEPSAYTDKHCSEGIVIKGETTLKLKGIKFCSR